MLIGLAGKSQAGKSTIAEYLTAHSVHDFYEVSFAEPIQEFLPFILNISHECFSNPNLKDRTIEGLNKTPRQIVDSFCNDWGREMIHPALWETIVQQKILEIRQHSPTSSIVVPDVRSNTQANLIRNHGGNIWHIERPANPYPSTRGLSEYPITILRNETIFFNDGSFEKMNSTIEQLLTDMTAKKANDHENPTKNINT